MTAAPHPLDDPTVERLLHRASLDGSADVPAELEPVARFLAAVADLGDVPVQPRGALADLLADGFAPAAPTPVPLRVRLARLRRPIARLAGVGLVAQVLTGTGVAVASVTAAAGAGVLPASIQQPVGQVLNVVTPFRFPTAPTGVQETEETGSTVEPAPEEPQPAPAEAPAQTAVTAEDTSGPAVTTEPTEASAEPTSAGSTSTTPTTSPTPTTEPTSSASTTPTTSPTAATEPTTSPSTTPTTSPTPTAEPTPTASSRPTRQNEKPDKGEPTDPPLDDPALVAVD